MVLLHIFCVLPFTEFDVSHHYQGRAGDKNQLQSPQADMGDGEDVVVADVGAARLEGKTTIEVGRLWTRDETQTCGIF